VIGWILIQLNTAYTIYSSKDLPTPKQSIDVAGLPEGKAPDDPNAYHVWHAIEGNPQGVPQGKYLVDDQGSIRYLVDPGINGKRSRRDDGTEVPRFRAPKATLMAMITDGILQQRLPWPLVLLGVSIAIVLELCRVPSLPFAVGVYLPLSSSTPIFAGGLVRFGADWWMRRTQGSNYSEADSDSSPGVLLATGYIAGGAIAGVLIAFLSFKEDIPKKLAEWQYSRYTLAQPMSLKEASRRIATEEVGDPSAAESEKREKLQKEMEAVAGEIESLNAADLPQFVTVPAGTKLKLPGNATEDVRTQSTLGELARELRGSPDKAQSLLDLNKDQLKLPEQLPAGTQLKLPQQTMPAIYAFAGLMLLLLLVGMGWLLKAPPTSRARFRPDSPSGDGYDFTGDEVGLAKP
jgi:hypothetical protein